MRSRGSEPPRDRGVVRGLAAGDPTVRARLGRELVGIELAVHAVLEQQQRLGAQLRDPALAHAELVGEVLHRTLFEEVADDDAAQPLGQRGDRVGEHRAALAVEDRVLGAEVAGGEELLGVAFEHERVVVEDRRAVHVVDELVHASRSGGASASAISSGVGGRPSRFVSSSVRLLHAAGPGPHRAARPVAAAQLVEQRAADAGRGEAVERDAPLGVEAAGGLGEARACPAETRSLRFTWLGTRWAISEVTYCTSARFS